MQANEIEINFNSKTVENRLNITEETDAKENNTFDTLNLMVDHNNNVYYFIKQKGRFLLETLNEKKNYEDKVNALNNRIKKLQDQEKEINKKTGKLKEKYVIEQKIKSEKEEKKDLIENYKVNNEKKIEDKKLEIEVLRKQRKEDKDKQTRDLLLKNKVNNFIKNQKVYSNAKNEKIFWRSIETDIKSHNSNLKNYKYLKVKQVNNDFDVGLRRRKSWQI